MVVGGSRFNLLLLEEKEVYLIDRPSLICSFRSVGNEDDDSQQQKFIPCIARLCSKSLIVHPDHSCLPSRREAYSPLTKIPFDRIVHCALHNLNPSLSDPPVLALKLKATEIVRIPISIVAGQLRAVSPYKVEKASCDGEWCIELRGSSFSSSSSSGSLLRETTGAAGKSNSSQVGSRQIRHNVRESQQRLKRLLTHDDAHSTLQTPSTNTFLTVVYDLLVLLLHSRSVPTEYNASNANPSEAVTFLEVLQKISDAVPSPSAFPLARVISHRERLIHPVIRAELQLPMHTARCLLILTDDALHVVAHPSRGDHALDRLPWSWLQHAFSRIISLRSLGLALLYAWQSGSKSYDWREVVLLLSSESDRLSVVQIIKTKCPAAFRASEDPGFLQHCTELWVRGELDSFHYLDFCNTLANRSREDFAQYPVMPWTFVDFTSHNVDLTSPAAFRDLTTPVGALNTAQLTSLKKRMDDATTHAANPEPRFLYGAHYSTPGYIVYWLARKYPECQLRLQGGRLDAWPRLFHSLNSTWACLKDGRTGSFMELIPEFYCPMSTDFLENRLGLNIPRPATSGGGGTDAHDTVNPKLGVLADVEFPPWANGSAFNTLKILREAMESPLVSSSLHHWIDLIFGYKQRGREAELSQNVYHPVTYLTSLVAQGGPEADAALQSVLAPLDHSQEALLAQVREFGQAPVRLFNRPHPQRSVTSASASSPPDLQNLRSLLEFLRSFAPWFVFFLQRKELQCPIPSSIQATPPLGDGSCPVAATAVASSANGHLWVPKTRKNGAAAPGGAAASHSEISVTDATPLRFKRSEVLSLFNGKKKYFPPLVTCVHEIPDEQSELLWLGCDDGLLRRFSLTKRRKVYPSFPVSSVPITAIASFGNDTAVIGDQRGSLHIYKKTSCPTSSSNYPEGYTSAESPHADTIFSLATASTSPCNRRLVCSISSDQTLGVWDIITSGEPRLVHALDVSVSAVALQGDVLLTGGFRGEIALWDLRCLKKGPVWMGEAWSKHHETRLCVSSCTLKTHDTTFSVAGFTQNGTKSPLKHFLPSVCPSSEDCLKQPASGWEALLCDMRMLSTATYPFPSNAQHSLTARFSWAPKTALFNVLTDGMRWAIGAGVLTFNPPPLDEVNQTSNLNAFSLPNSSCPAANLCTFASVADLSEGFRSREICRWPLQLTTAPQFIAPTLSWRIRNVGAGINRQLWFADQFGSIESIY